jgi:hypothetical protein
LTWDKLSSIFIINDSAQRLAFIGVAMDKIVEHWIERSQYDLDSRQAVIKTYLRQALDQHYIARQTQG